VAASWDSTITVTDLAAKTIRVAATRTDGEDVRTYSCDAVIDPDDMAGSKLRAANAIRDAYLADAARESAVSAMLDGWAAALNAWLEGQET